MQIKRSIVEGKWVAFENSTAQFRIRPVPTNAQIQFSFSTRGVEGISPEIVETIYNSALLSWKGVSMEGTDGNFADYPFNEEHKKWVYDNLSQVVMFVVTKAIELSVEAISSSKK